MRACKADKEGWIAVHSALKVSLEVELRSCIKVDFSFFIPLTKDYTLTLVEVYILTVHLYEFAYTHTC